MRAGVAIAFPIAHVSKYCSPKKNEGVPNRSGESENGISGENDHLESPGCNIFMSGVPMMDTHNDETIERSGTLLTQVSYYIRFFILLFTCIFPIYSWTQ